MRYRLLLVIMAALFTSCGKQDLGGTDKYVLKFEEEAARHNRHVYVNIEIKVTDEPLMYPNSIGTCYQSLTRSFIYLKRSWWESASETSREYLLFHELGHCVLNREHKNDINEVTEPVSIMYPTIKSAAFYERNREKLIQELFNGK